MNKRINISRLKRRFISCVASTLSVVMMTAGGGIGVNAASTAPDNTPLPDRTISTLDMHPAKAVAPCRSIPIPDIDENDDAEMLTVTLSADDAASAIPEVLSQQVEELPGERNVPVYIDNERYMFPAFIRDDTTYVGFRAFCTVLHNAEIEWNDDQGTAYAITDDVTVSASMGEEYISSNGRYFWARTGIIVINHTMYVPIRTLSAAFGASVEWSDESFAVFVTRGNGTITSGDRYYDSDEVYWLSKIINAKSRGESLSGKIAVGNVVLNRVRDPQYPNTIYGVIFDRTYGVQFSPTADGSINLEPDEASIIAAKLCLEGYTVSDSILFFINSRIATDMWVSNNRTLTVSIGRHDFYS